MRNAASPIETRMRDGSHAFRVAARMIAPAIPGEAGNEYTWGVKKGRSNGNCLRRIIFRFPLYRCDGISSFR